MASSMDDLTNSNDSNTFKHQDGHITGLAHYGNLDGSAVFYFHGLPSSRLEGGLLDAVAKQSNAHIIALDRPGMGLSSPMPGRKLLDWPPMVLEIAEQLGIDEFYILGTSAGGPYALACAKALPVDKLKGVGVIAGMSPVILGIGGMTFNAKLAIYATKWAPWIGRVLYDWTVIPAARNADPAVFEKMVTDGLAYLSDHDRQLWQDSPLSNVFVEASREHFRQGNKGLLDEWRIFVSDWGFQLNTIEHDRVMLWCGTEDVICPVVLSRRMAAEMPTAHLVEFEGATHYSILFEKTEEILKNLLQR